ncbi:MAG: DegT/DnrJ/EryC1/StrS family aminotransferase [Vicinamibacterales bacterium]|nr:DegT/DnrJ/EryC1/StrS family aminotransferase [Vicinamibacterales bacterium]
MADNAVIPLAVPDLRGNEAAYLARCVAENWVSSAGPEVRALETRMAQLCGVDHAVATVNGTTALHLALITAGVGPGDLVALGMDRIKIASGELTNVEALRTFAGFGLPVILSTGMTTLDEVGGVSHAWPQFLPDGDHFLFVTTSLDPQEAGIRIGSLETGNVSSPIVQTGFMARFAAPGYLLFDRGGALMAQRFDTDQLELTGDPVRVVDGVLSDPTLGSLGVSTSDRGGLAYVPAAGSTLTQLRWLDRSGNELGTVGAPGDYQNPVLSPDERRVAVQRDGDIWLLDLERGTDQRFTFDPADDQWPVWSPDGDRILFASARETRPFDLYLKGTAGTDPAQLLLETDELKVPFGWSTDGEQVSFTTLDADYDLWLLPMSGDRQPTSFLSTPFQDASGVISPDGHWMAYWSDESVEFRVYVRTVPPSGGQWQISTAAGFAPRWSADGRELYWTTENNQLMAVDIDVTGDAPIVIGTPQQLFEAPFRQTPIQRNVFDVSADGERFLVNTLVEGALSAPITWVLNWPAELEPAP